MIPVSQILQVVGLVLNFVGAILFAFPVIKSKKAIEEESSTYLGHNPPLRKAMQRERLLGIIGLLFLLIGFAMRIIAICLQERARIVGWLNGISILLLTHS